MLEPDRDQLEMFVDAMFRHASEGFVAVRSFHEGADKPFRLSTAAMTGGLRFLIDVAEDDARRAAQAVKPVVFCPPLATFTNKEHAGEKDIAEGLVLSVELDENPQQARADLEELIGPATLVVKSGGQWLNGGEAEDKLHLHWRLTVPARGASNLSKLKQARDLACRIVGGDPSNKPICHPIRWPGSWHRKAEPRLCRIAVVDADREIDLDVALEVLKQAAPEAAKANTNDKTDKTNQQDWAQLVADIISGKSYHQPLRDLAAGLVGSGCYDGTSVKLLRAIMKASTAEHDVTRWQVRYDGIPRAVRTARDKYAAENKPEEPPRTASGKTLLWPYEARPFSDIPRRCWLHAGHYIRGQVVMTVAPGGYGKTSLEICNSLEMATARGLIGPPPSSGPLNVGYWNAEDPDEEIERRIAAACLRHEIDPTSLQGRLFLGSQLTGKQRIASIDYNDNVVFDATLLNEIERLIKELHIDCVIFDPLVAFHRVPESDNTIMEQIIKDGFGELAVRCDCCIELSQHTRKSTHGRQGDLTADDSRGAGAIVNAARSVRVLNRMTAEEAELPKIEPEDRRQYLRVARDKTNLVPAGKAIWIRLASVELPNSEGLKPGDSVQVVEAWDYPQPFDNVTVEDMHWMRGAVRQGSYRASPRSPNWVGCLLAARLGLDVNDPGDRRRLNSILRIWFANGVLAVETRTDAQRHSREYVIPGQWKED
jgi:hypothetical protein